MRSCSTCWLHTHTGTHTGTRRHHKNTCEQEHASTASRCVFWYPRTDAGTRGHNTLPVKPIITIGRAKEQPLLDHCTLGSRLRYEGKCIISKLQTAPPLEDLPSVTLVASTVHLQVIGVLGLVLAPPVVKGGGDVQGVTTLQTSGTHSS